MLGIAGWARDVLLSRGALVETPEEEALRALLPPEVSAALSAGEWLSLNFRAGAGADDAAEWLERLGHLLEAGPGGAIAACRVAGARLRGQSSVPPLNAEAVLARELVVQNGIYRLVEDSSTAASYFLFTFEYTVESDERSVGFLTMCLNSTAQSSVAQPEKLLSLLRDELEEVPSFRAPVAELARIYPAAAAAARAGIRKLLTGLETSANRRLARDAERVESYYRGLLEQIQKRIVRRAADAEAAGKERSRARATELDRADKLEDLRRKYSLRLKMELTDVLAFALPVRQISVRLVRKKEERARLLHWNSVLRRLEPPLCERCWSGAYPLYLCEKIHCLCQECWAPCRGCARFFCPVCQPRCKCGKVPTAGGSV